MNNNHQKDSLCLFDSSNGRLTKFTHSEKRLDFTLLKCNIYVIYFCLNKVFDRFKTLGKQNVEIWIE